MPIKELMALSTAIVIGAYVTHPMHPREALRNLEIRMLREATKTSDWGNPDIFQYAPKKHHHAHKKSHGPA